MSVYISDSRPRWLLIRSRLVWDQERSRAKRARAGFGGMNALAGGIGSTVRKSGGVPRPLGAFYSYYTQGDFLPCPRVPSEEAWRGAWGSGNHLVSLPLSAGYRGRWLIVPQVELSSGASPFRLFIGPRHRPPGRTLSSVPQTAAPKLGTGPVQGRLVVWPLQGERRRVTAIVVCNCRNEEAR